jgi:two-component sensor histidine kinase
LKSPDNAAITARDVLRRIFPHERRRLLNMVRASLEQGRPLTTDIRLRRFDGEFCWLALRAQPMTNESGQVIGFVGIAQDITAQKQSLSRTDSLLREVSHRSKNMLALILAMARLTAREAVDVQSHLKEFALRVAGLAASQDLIVAADWQSVDFSTLAAAEIEAVARSDATRIELSGPSFLVTPEAAQTLGMILTELSLDSTRYGALSVAAGKVHLSWALNDKRTITISWRETGGPGRHPERDKGYGMSVVERFSTQGLKLQSGVSGGADRFTWTVSGPLANIGTVSPRARRDGRA